MPPEDLLPCHVVAGPLGVGKTTAILDYLARHAGEQEVGVLVNDFGPAGLDGAILGEDGEGRVVSVPGGCVCCASAEGLVTSIQRMLQRRLDRLIIEPSGMADPARVLDLLRQIAGESRLEVRPVIALLSATDFTPERASRMPFYRHMADAADILVLNRCDAAEDGVVEAFRAWAAELDPPKTRVVTTKHGRLGDALFELPTPESGPDRPAGQSAADHPDAGHAASLSWSADQPFDHAALTEALRTIAANGVAGVAILRLKGFFHTDSGWRLCQIAEGELSLQDADPQPRTTAEWVSAGEAVSPQAMARALTGTS